MTDPAPARGRAERIADAKARLEQDVDVWVSTADPATGTPYLVPLSFLWDGTAVTIATPATNPTGRNLLATGQVRLGFGPTRDVVLVEGVGTATPAERVPAPVGDAFAARAGFDPREGTGYVYVRVVPRRVLAWREENELSGRELMRDGRWLDP